MEDAGGVRLGIQSALPSTQYPKYFVFRENISLQDLNIEEKNGHDDNNIQVTKDVYSKKMTIKIILEWLGFTHFK